MKRDFVHAGETVHTTLKALGADRFAITVAGRAREVVAMRLPSGAIRFTIDGETFAAESAPLGKAVQVRIAGHTWTLSPAQGKARAGAEGAAKTIEAPMSGTVTKVLVAKGGSVEKGQTLVVLTAMKMEHKLAAGAAGKVAELMAKEGATVEQGALLVRIE